jgi:hypothetical protein
VNRIEISGGGADDTLIVDSSNGLINRTNTALTINYDGGIGADGLRLEGGSATSASYTSKTTATVRLR